MRPKEKANKLANTFLFEVNFDGNKQEEAIHCALIFVNEMLDNAMYIWGGRDTETGLSARDGFRKYWQEVKEELEKL